MYYDFIKIGNRIRELRNRKGWSQTELIEQLANKNYPIGRNTISAIENGCFTTENLNLKLLLTLCDIFDCETGYLLCEHNHKSIDSYIIYRSLGLTEKTFEYLKENKDTTLIDYNAILPTDNEITLSESLNHILEKYPSLILYLGNFFLNIHETPTTNELALNLAMYLADLFKSSKPKIYTNDHRYSFVFDIFRKRLNYLEKTNEKLNMQNEDYKKRLNDI